MELLLHRYPVIRPDGRTPIYVLVEINESVATHPTHNSVNHSSIVSGDMVLIGSGGRGHDDPGAFLTASYPDRDLRSWLVSTKDHDNPDLHQATDACRGY